MSMDVIAEQHEFIQELKRENARLRWGIRLLLDDIRKMKQRPVIEHVKVSRPIGDEPENDLIDDRPGHDGEVTYGGS